MWWEPDYSTLQTKLSYTKTYNLTIKKIEIKIGK